MPGGSVTVTGDGDETAGVPSLDGGISSAVPSATFGSDLVSCAGEKPTNRAESRCRAEGMISDLIGLYRSVERDRGGETGLEASDKGGRHVEHRLETPTVLCQIAAAS